MKRNRDSQDTALELGLMAWSVLGGALGLLLGAFLAARRGWPLIPVALGFAVLAAAIIFFGVGRLAQMSADAGARIILPSGTSTPARPGYSHAESLEVRGRYEEAAAEYERAASEDASAAEPCLRLARLARDRLGDAESAVGWFRRARNRTDDAGLSLLITRELLHVLATELGAPERALPDLARLAERHADTQAGAWAKAEIRRLKIPPTGAEADEH